MKLPLKESLNISLPALNALRQFQRQGTPLFYMTDHLNSSTLITDIGGNEIQRMDFEPYGALIENARSGNFMGIRHTYTGQEEDPETGLMYYQARYYDPVVGIFTSADSLIPNPSIPQSFNRFSYANNSPIIYIDPTGHLSLNPINWVKDTVRFVGNTYDAIKNGDVKSIIITAAVIAAAVYTGGAASAYMQTIMTGYGSSLGGSIFAGAVTGAVAGAAGGTAAGFVGGFGSGILSGRSFGESWSAGVEGAFCGAVSGTITGGVVGAGVGAYDYLSRTNAIAQLSNDEFENLTDNYDPYENLQKGDVLASNNSADTTINDNGQIKLMRKTLQDGGKIPINLGNTPKQVNFLRRIWNRAIEWYDKHVKIWDKESKSNFEKLKE